MFTIYGLSVEIITHFIIINTADYIIYKWHYLKLIVNHLQTMSPSVFKLIWKQSLLVQIKIQHLLFHSTNWGGGGHWVWTKIPNNLCDVCQNISMYLVRHGGKNEVYTEKLTVPSCTLLWCVFFLNYRSWAWCSPWPCSVSRWKQRLSTPNTPQPPNNSQHTWIAFHQRGTNVEPCLSLILPPSLPYRLFILSVTFLVDGTLHPPHPANYQTSTVTV